MSHEQRIKRIRFTLDELFEMRRALGLIMQEDDYAGVNMEAASVAAASSAREKVRELIRRCYPHD